MKEIIKEVLYKDYSADEKKWIFFSWFDENLTELFSNWVVYTEDELDSCIDSLYSWVVEDHEKSLKYTVIDVVDNIQELTNPEDILKTDPQKYWFFLICQDSDDTWAILPNIEWVADAKHALSLVKKKYNLSGKVEVFVFTTNRIVI